jgi:ABC-type branched-subunit amino acid transport system substrate-binding protein
MIKTKSAIAALGALALMGTDATALAQVQGVSAGEIVLGTHLDLSGPINFWGLPVKNGMEMAVADVNAAGGIHGRKIKLIIEDMGYDPKKAVLATQKMLTNDRIFAMVGSMGTVTSAATMPLVLAKGLPHLFPITPAEMFSTPFEKLKFAYFSPYYDDVRTSLKYLVQTKGKKRVGILYQDDEFGADILRGAKDQLAAMNLPLVSTTSYKRGATDFASQISRLKSDDVDLIVLGTIVRETVGAMGTARKMGWNVDFVVSQAGYAPVVATLGEGVTEGLYAGGMTPVPYADTASSEVKAWMARYKEKFGQDANIQAVVGYLVLDTAVIGMRNAGPNLTPESLVGGLEKISNLPNMFGSAPITFTSTDHLATRKTFVAQIKNGRWEKLTDFMHY